MKDPPPPRRRLTFSDRATNELPLPRALMLGKVSNTICCIQQLYHLAYRYTCRTSPVMIDLTVLTDDSDSGSAPIPSSKR